MNVSQRGISLTRNHSSRPGGCAFIASWKVIKRGRPAILFFGTEDQFQDKARDFARQLIAAEPAPIFIWRRPTDLAAGQRHAFFNRFPNLVWHALLLRQIDLFLTSLAYLKGDPNAVLFETEHSIPGPDSVQCPNPANFMVLPAWRWQPVCYSCRGD